MSDIFGFLMLFSPLALIIGLIKPRLVMWFKLPKTRKAVILFYISLTILFAVLLCATAPEIKETSKQTSTIDSIESRPATYIPKPAPSDKEIAQFFKLQIDSIDALYSKKELVFDTYQENINPVIAKLRDTITSRTEAGLKASSLQSLYAKSSEKYETTKAEYQIYGDGDEVSLRASAEEFLSQNANDPGSVDIQTSFKCGKKKDGWVYYVRYRAKNGFGALILTDVKLLMRYDSSSGMFNILKAY